MKTQSLTTSLLFVFINSFSQITVYDNDIIDIGDNIYEAIHNISGSSIQIGPSGPNQTWDFSNLQQGAVNIIEHVDPSITPYGALHSTSNICAQDDGESIYFKKSSTAIEIVGIDNQQLVNPILALPLPLTYPMQFTTGPILGISEIEPNILVDDSVAPLITSGATHNIDSLKINIYFESTYIVDGYGDVIIPMGTFPSLRLSVESSRTTEIFFYCTDTLSGSNSGWYTVPPPLTQALPFSTEPETDFFYQWWSNDPLVKFALVNIDVDEYGYNDSEVRFLTNNPTSIEDKNVSNFSVFPVPATYKLNIESLDNLTTNLTLRDNNGKLILNNQFVTQTSLSLEVLAKGIYYLTLKNERNTLFKKVVIE